MGGGTAFEAVDLIPVFHRWIQEGALEGLLIDVVDYSHVPGGPGVLLVGDEGYLGVAAIDNKVRLSYSRRRPGAELASERLVGDLRRLVNAQRLLATEDSFDVGLVFDWHRLRVCALDRLKAPNDDVARRDFEEMLGEALAPTLGPLEFESGASDPRVSLELTISLTGPGIAESI